MDLATVEAVVGDVEEDVAGYKAGMTDSALAGSGDMTWIWALASAGRGTIAVGVVVDSAAEGEDEDRDVDRHGTCVRYVAAEVVVPDSAFHAVVCHC